MANVNTIAGFFNGTGRNQIPVLSGVGVTETIISTNTDTGTAPAVLSIPLQTAILGSSNGLGPNGNQSILVPPFGVGNNVPDGVNAPYFNSGSFNGRPFLLRCAGTFTSGVATNDLQIGLYLGTSATIGSDTAISTAITTGTGGAFGAVSGHFLLETELLWDATSGKVDGTISGYVAPSGVARLPVGGNAPAYISQFSAAAASNLNFLISAKWNATNAGNLLQVTEWSLNLI